MLSQGRKALTEKAYCFTTHNGTHTFKKHSKQYYEKKLKKLRRYNAILAEDGTLGSMRPSEIER
jgi:hypothetical protein